MIGAQITAMVIVPAITRYLPPLRIMTVVPSADLMQSKPTSDEWYPIIAPTGSQTNEGYIDPFINLYYPSITAKYEVTISLPTDQGGGTWGAYEYQSF